MRILTVLALVLAFTAPALARGKGSGGNRADPTQNTDEKKKRDSELERAANKALATIPDKKFDAWGNVRSTDKPSVH